MASTPGAPTSTMSSQPDSSRQTAPRGRGRGGHNTGRGPDSFGAPDRGRGRARGRGGGGGRGRGADSNNQQTTASGKESQHQQLPVRELGGQSSTDSAQANGNPMAKDSAAQAEDEVDAEVCFICASPVVHNAVSPCNHRTCHICALRLRALYKTKACAHCRTNAEYVIFTDSPDKRFEDFADDNGLQVDANLGIKYEKPDIFEDTVLLLRYNCPDETCDVACLGWPDLHKHVKSIHHKVMCDLCTRNKKVFTHEHELFTFNALKKHERFGDDHPGAEDQTGFKGHPECGFCRERFYGDDELYAHCRDKHERCHICDRRDGGRSQQYYVNYDSLELHFRKDHFLCPDTGCLEKKFVVFENEIDLKGHQLEEHPNGLTKDARRDARRVDMSGFQFRDQYQQERGGRGGRGRGRGRPPGSEPLPQPPAQPLRRDELAFQRTMAIQSAQSVTPRNFGGSLTPAQAAAPPANAREPSTVTATRPRLTQSEAYPSLGAPSVGSVPTSPQPQNAVLTPTEQARRLRHQAVNERAATLLKNDAGKLNTFRERVSSYKNNAITAPQLIDAFFTLFDTSAAELGKLVKEIADIFEIASKKESLMKAWNDWRAINEDYPSLPGPSGAAPAGSSANPNALGKGGMRVLKLKSSTAQSGRSGLGRQGSWGTASNASSNGGPFPPLSAAAAPSASVASARQARPAWWTAAAATQSNHNTTDTKVVLSSGGGGGGGGGGGASARSSPATSAAPSRTATPSVRSKEAFPELPKAAKPTSTVFSPGYTGYGVRRDTGLGGAPRAAGANAWGGAGAASATAAAAGDADGVEGEAAKKKGNKGKKQYVPLY